MQSKREFFTVSKNKTHKLRIIMLNIDGLIYITVYLTNNKYNITEISHNRGKSFKYSKSALKYIKTLKKEFHQYFDMEVF